MKKQPTQQTGETFLMFKRNTLKYQHKHRQPWKYVLRQNCHLMALHSIELQWFTVLLFSTLAQYGIVLLSHAEDEHLQGDYIQHSLWKQWGALQAECRGFERLCEILASWNQRLHEHSSHISCAVRGAPSRTKWLPALCYRKYSRDMYPEEWHGKRVWSF